MDADKIIQLVDGSVAIVVALVAVYKMADALMSCRQEQSRQFDAVMELLKDSPRKD